jgi:hypothetical protein
LRGKGSIDISKKRPKLGYDGTPISIPFFIMMSSPTKSEQGLTVLDRLAYAARREDNPTDGDFFVLTAELSNVDFGGCFQQKTVLSPCRIIFMNAEQSNTAELCGWRVTCGQNSVLSSANGYKITGRWGL